MKSRNVVVYYVVIFLLIVVIGMAKSSGSNSDKILMFGNRNGLILLSPNSTEFTQVEANPLEGIRPIFLDYDSGTNTVYFSNQNNHRIGISKMQLDGLGHEVLIALDDESAAEGIAIDWIARNLYWVTPRQHKISVSRLDGSSPRDVVTGLGDPRDVCLDPANGYMYWSDWGEQPAIERSLLDGTGREALVTEDLGYPNGIAIDLVEGKLYWGDAYNDRIEVCDLNGSNRQSLIAENLEHVFGLSVLGDSIYWSDWRARRVERADRHTGENREVVYESERRVLGLKAVDINKIPEGTNTCGEDNGGCSHLCLYRPTPLAHVCACPDGMVLHPDEQGDGGRCHGYTTEVPSDSISTRLTTETTPPETTEDDEGISTTNAGPSETTEEMTDFRFSSTDAGFDAEDTTTEESVTIFTPDVDTTEMITDSITTSLTTETPAETTEEQDTTTEASVTIFNPDVDTTEMITDSITTSLTTETPVETTEEPPACPCKLSENSDAALDHFCLTDASIVLKATVLAVHFTPSGMTVLLRERKELFKDKGDDVDAQTLLQLYLVLRMDDTCICSDTIMTRRAYLFMGRMVDGKMSVSYVMGTDSHEYVKTVRTLRRRDTCVFHNWSKLQKQWASLSGWKV